MHQNYYYHYQKENQMNQNRIEMEKTLPSASQYLCQHIQQGLARAGVSANQNDVILIARLVSDYFVNSEHGKHTALRLLNAEVTDASYTKTYYPEGYYGNDAKAISFKDLKEYRGWIYKNKIGVPFNKVDISDRAPLQACEACGGMFPPDFCTATVKTYNNGKEYLETRCNHCRAHSDEARVRETAAINTCHKCVKTGCQYHPNKNKPVVMNNNFQASQRAAQVVASLPQPPTKEVVPPGWDTSAL